MPRLIPPPPPPPEAAGQALSMCPMCCPRERPTHRQTSRWVGGGTKNDEHDETKATNENKRNETNEGNPTTTKQGPARGGGEGRALSQN